ncbi:TonB-dependent receptor [Luminiphilus sp. nBUS_16]|uniref:TonB-dependent receptor n=1 Tax=Luminiphilus sp. nBUS_16 TaxID=3395315 RepID=UPI003EB73A6C
MGWKVPCSSARLTMGLLLGCVLISPFSSSAAQFPDSGAGVALKEVVVVKQSITLKERELGDRNFYALTDLGRLIPSLQTFVAGGGAGAGLYLRGVGASPLSAAFDASVPIIIDGVSLLPAGILQAGQADISTIEVLSGPQGLTYGRGATGGALIVTSNDPGEEFEAKLSASYLPEHHGAMLQGMLSVPIGSKFGARLAVSAREDNELRQNVVGAPSSTVDFRGRESVDARLTLLWNPNSDFRAKLKVSGSWSENDGPNWMAQMRCPDGELQTTRVSSEGSFGTPPPTWSCRADGTIAFPDNQVLLPDPDYSTWPLWNNGVPYEEQEAALVSLQLDWFLNDEFSVQAISAYGALKSDSMDVYDYAMGFGSAQYTNETTGWSQELRIMTHATQGLNIIAGAIYQDTRQDYLAGQNPMSYGLSAADLYTGNAYDWDRWQFSKNQHWSVYARLGWDMSKNLHLNAGLRYSEDQRSSRITIPYINAWLQADDFPLQGTTLQKGLDFAGDQLTPEVVLTWTPQIGLKLYGAFRSGYKSGGIDTSKMPYPGFDQLSPDAFIFDNETAEGFEFGARWHSRLNFQLAVTAHFLEYDDIQLQQFNSNNLQYVTPEGVEATSEGFAVDLMWRDRSGSFGLQANLAYVDIKFSSEFTNVEGDSLKGDRVSRAPQNTADLQADYQFDLQGGWQFRTGVHARYHDSYPLDDIRGAPQQQSFILYDAFVAFASPDDNYELSVLGLNLSDELYGMSGMARPFACPGECYAPTYPLSQFDQVITSALGRQYVVRLTVKF